MVVKTAARIADEPDVGMERLSLARIASELGVRTPSLYKHVAGLAALRRELTLFALRDLYDRLAQATVGTSSDDAVRAMAGAYRSFAHQHPGLYTAALWAPQGDDPEMNFEAQRLVSLLVRVLAGYGLERNDALHAVRCLRSLLHGFVSLEASHGFGLPLYLEETFRRLIDLLISGLRASQREASTGAAEPTP
jgi:AcrR family transcriptional regulator